MERFTQRARRVLSLAQEEAERLRHNYIGTEHLLLGLLREEGGVAGRVLRDLGLEQRKVEDLVEELTRATGRTTATTAELSPGTKRVLELTVDEARRLGHHYIGTEHMLLGLVRQSEGVAIDVLKRFGVSPEEVRRQTRRVLQESPVQTALPSDTPIPQRPAPRREGREVQYIGAGSMYLMESVLKKMLDMVGEGKLTIEQANELLLTLQPGLKLNTGMQAWLATLVNQKEQQDTRRVRVVVTNRETNEELHSLTMSLLEGLEKLDQLLLATVPDNQLKSVAFESDSSPIRIEIHVEKDKDQADE